MLPQTIGQVVLLLVTLVPGLAYRAVRLRAKGVDEADRTLAQRAVRAFVTSVAFGAAYLWIAGRYLVDLYRDSIEGHRVNAAGGWVIILAILVPCSAAYAVNFIGATIPPAIRKWLYKAEDQERELTWIEAKGQWFDDNVIGRFAQVTPWDRVVNQKKNTWVRIRKADGTFILGYFDRYGYVSTYPDSPSIWLSKQAMVNKKGKYSGDVDEAEGLWYALAPGDHVEFIGPQPPEV